MARTTANAKAIRELCGVTQQAMADALGVRTMTVKRWEKGEPPIPDDALAWLMEAASEHDRGVEEAVSSVLASAGAGDEVCMTYYRSQEQADAAALPEKATDYRFANAVTRSAAERLKAYGYRVSFTYPGEERRYSGEIG